MNNQHLIDHNYFLPVIYENIEQDSVDVSSESDENVEEDVIGVPESYTIIPGIRHGTKIYVDNLGFKYYKRETRNTNIYLVCERQKNGHAFCPGSAKVNANQVNNIIKILKNHNHEPTRIDLHIPFLREAISAIGIDRSNTASSRTIYNNKIVQHPEAAKNYTFIQAQNRLKKMKCSRRPQNPDNIHELAEILNEHHMVYAATLQTVPSRFFQQELVVNERSVGVIFANMDAIRRYEEQLRVVTLVGIDGTFKTVPCNPRDLKCFLTIQVVYKSVSFPMVYVLLGNMTEETYSTLFRIVRHILPLNYNLITFITDYERGLMNAVQQTFPESKLRCCWFHFTQSIVRYCHRRMNSVLDLVKTYPEAARVLRMVLALPHLPDARGHPQCPNFSMHDGFRAIMQYIQQFPEIERGMRNFLIGYVENFWLLQVGSQFISIFGEEYRTNNYLESFHATLLMQMGRHPNIWDFIRE